MEHVQSVDSVRCADSSPRPGTGCVGAGNPARAVRPRPRRSSQCVFPECGHRTMTASPSAFPARRQACLGDEAGSATSAVSVRSRRVMLMVSDRGAESEADRLGVAVPGRVEWRRVCAQMAQVVQRVRWALRSRLMRAWRRSVGVASANRAQISRHHSWRCPAGSAARSSAGSVAVRPRRRRPRQRRRGRGRGRCSARGCRRTVRRPRSRPAAAAGCGGRWCVWPQRCCRGVLGAGPGVRASARR